VLIDVVQKAPEMLVSIMEIGLLMKGHFLLLDGTHQALGVAILRGLADGGHTDVGANVSQGLNRCRRGILDPLVGMMDLGPMLRQGPPQRRQGQRLIHLPAQLPAPDAARIHVHHHGQLDELIPHAHVGDIPDPHLIGADNRQSVHQITVPWVGMGPVGRPNVPCWGSPLETHLAPEPRHVLAVDLPAFAVQRGREAAIPRRWPGLGETYDRRLPSRAITGLRAVIITAARVPQDAADLAHRRGMAEPPDYLP
jgi:hypothetical protein